MVIKIHSKIRVIKPVLVCMLGIIDKHEPVNLDQKCVLVFWRLATRKKNLVRLLQPPATFWVPSNHRRRQRRRMLDI